MDVIIRVCAAAHTQPWLSMRQTLWPEADPAILAADIDRLLAATDGGRYLALVALTGAGQVVGFAEASLRRDYVNGCAASPVGFLEGIYVEPGYRKKGVARALCAAVQSWVKAQGCTEFASDAYLDDRASHLMHAALGFEETERVVYFRKVI